MALKYTSEQPWQLSCSGLKERGESLLASAQWMDCTFVVGAGERISAHRLVLSSASPVFATMLYGPLAGDKDEDIAVPDIEPDAFKLLLQYVYTNDVDIPSCRIACDLYYAAQKYMVLGLVAACSSYLTCRLDPQTACRAYELALCMQNTDLMDRSIREIKVRTEEVLTAPSFIDAHIETVSSIFEMETLNVDSEMALVEAAERYARSQYENSQQSLPEDQNEDSEHSESPTTLKNCSLIQQIRFLTLTAEELEKYATWTSLLTEAEISALAANIRSQDAQEQIPCDFSSIRTSRKKPSSEESLDPNTFRVRIENVRELQHFRSQRHKLHGLKWKLEAVEGKIGPYLVLKSGLSDISRPVQSVEMRVLRRGFEPLRLTESDGLRTDFSAAWEWFSVIEWDNLLNPDNGYLEDGAITVEVYAEKSCNIFSNLVMK